MRFWFTFALLCTVSGLLPLAALAQPCSMLRTNVEEARSKLRRAANETDLEQAKDAARRARTALDDAAMSAQDCKCQMAWSEFDTAATRARRARDADDADDFVDNLNGSIRSFNSAIDAINMCAAERQR